MAPHERFLLGDTNSIIRANIAYSVGTVTERRGELEPALGWYRSALASHPHHTVSRYRAAALCLALGHYAEAERELASVAVLPSPGAVGKGAPEPAPGTTAGDLAGVGSMLMPPGVPQTDMLLQLTMGKAKQQMKQFEAAIAFFTAAVASCGAAGVPAGEPLLHRAQSWLALSNAQVWECCMVVVGVFVCV